MSGGWALVPSANDSKGLGTELKQLPLLSSLASLGPSGILSHRAWGDGDKDHPARDPILTLLTGQAGADVAAHSVGAGAVPRALHPLRALIDIC